MFADSELRLREKYKVNIFCKITNNAVPESNPDEPSEKIDDNNNENKSNITEEDIRRLSLVEFQSQSYASFYSTTMEKDKSILTLSVAGIGFLVTVLNLSKTINYIHYGLFVAAALLFLISIYCILTIFDKNADFIVDITQKRDVTLKTHKLKVLDSWAIKTFYLAILISTLLGIATSIALINP
ncbi:hypothetical protein [Aeromonas dhakensis]|uniref:hypothetical protein n=1 Tax=Aeromonas dhakensis TaxID=196024 RepID=UPI00191E1E0A|nr:hypothetical protein [Aeromonas dhakensis]MBL0679182.1 hypothetical protein [Aeromonas dhakensis]